jgi:ABC-2 type transport system permease protein
LIIDVLRPKLEWNDPQEAVKQNLNGFFSILLTFIALGCWGGLSILLFNLGIPEGWVYVILGLSTAVLLIPSLIILYSLAEASYKKLEI